MIKVEVTNTKTNQIGWAGQFPDQETANTWVINCEANYMWGKPQRTLVANEQGTVMDIDGSAPNLSLATSTGTTIDSNGVTVNTYAMPAEYVVTQTDITAQYNQELLVQTALNNQQLGATIIANVAALNDSLLASGTMTSAQFTTLLADQTLLNIERLCWNGSLATAKTLIQANMTDLEQYYTSAQIQQILALFP